MPKQSSNQRVDDNSLVVTLLKSIDDKTNRTDDTLKSLAQSMNELAVAMAKQQVASEQVQKQQMLQKEIDEHQNFKIDVLESDLNNVDRRLITQENKVTSLEKKLESQEEVIKGLKEEQNVDSHNWNTLKGVGSFILKFVVPPILAVIGSALVFLFNGGKTP